MTNKKTYDVKLDVLVPATITYRVSATSELEALKEIEKASARKLSTYQHMSRRIKLKATVYLPSSTTIKFSKIYRSI